MMSIIAKQLLSMNCYYQVIMYSCYYSKIWFFEVCMQCCYNKFTQSAVSPETQIIIAHKVWAKSM